MRLRVLVVEDHDDTRAAITTALRGDGHHVIEASNGVEALSRYKLLLHGNLAPDVVISDACMPGMHGLALIACIRAAGCTCPILLVTAYDTRGTREQARSLDVEVIPKPFELDALRHRVEACVA